jgi:FkbM family methyltransferase
MVFVDIGAHIGEYTLLAAKAVGPTGQVHAFEPQTELAALIERSAQMNDFHNVTVNASAVSDRIGQQRFTIRRDLSCSSLSQADSYGDHRILSRRCVPVDTLDHYCLTRGIQPHVVKVDVEGAELSVLKGAARLLARPGPDAPTWILEFSHDNYARHGITGEEFERRLTETGYRLYEIDQAGLRPCSLSLDRTINVLAVRT